MPSISVNIYVKIQSLTSLPPLFLARASISSKNIMLGALIQAYLKISLIFFSLFPTYLSNTSGPFTEKKFIFPSVAIAFANMVLEHPGGP